MSRLVTALAAKLEVVERVSPTRREWNPMVDLQPAAGAAADAGLVAFVDARADLAPRPTVPDLASRLPVVVPSRAGLAA